MKVNEIIMSRWMCRFTLKERKKSAQLRELLSLDPEGANTNSFIQLSHSFVIKEGSLDGLVNWNVKMMLLGSNYSGGGRWN